jgi:acetyl esterase
VGSPETHGPIVRRLAEALACEAWSVDYALAPEAPFPNGLSDCEAAIELAQSEHPDAQLIVAGDSAGANLAMAATLRLRDRAGKLPHALLLFYGVYTDDCGGASMGMYGDGRYGLSIDAHRRYMQAYAGGKKLSPTDARYVFPLRANADLRGLPPSFLLAAQVDILRDQSHDFATALRAARVETALDEAEGVTHGFLSYGKALPEVGEALARAARFVGAR